VNGRNSFSLSRNASPVDRDNLVASRLSIGADCFHFEAGRLYIVIAGMQLGSTILTLDESSLCRGAFESTRIGSVSYSFSVQNSHGRSGTISALFFSIDRRARLALPATESDCADLDQAPSCAS
jgi:hypothetical protein